MESFLETRTLVKQSRLANSRGNKKRKSLLANKQAGSSGLFRKHLSRIFVRDALISLVLLIASNLIKTVACKG